MLREVYPASNGGLDAGEVAVKRSTPKFLPKFCMVGLHASKLAPYVGCPTRHSCAHEPLYLGNSIR